jgi:putative Holliday junction resolvase
MKKYERIMAIDFGEIRIGIAFSDLLKTIASPFETYKRVGDEKDISYLSNLAKEKETCLIIFGLPLNMDGTEGERAKRTREFGEKLSQASNISVEYIDERLTSVEAEEMLIQAGYKREARKGMIDKVAATLILESYLNKK